MIFEIFDSSGKALTDFEVVSYELSSEIAAACDGLRLYIFTKKALSDVRTVCAYQDGVKIFYGFADKFQLSYDEDGYTAFVYARSSACVLVDNEAYPGQYSCPTSRQLWYIHAKPFGFTFGLPEVFTQSEYIVSKGQSCFGAIDKFMQYACGKRIYVTPENEVCAFDTSENVRYLDADKIVSVCATVDKSSVIGRIDYKINSDEQYIYRLESRFADDNAVTSRKLINLSSLPVWQREAEAHRQISESLENYFTVTVILAGDCDLRLSDRVSANFERLGISGEFILSSIIRAKNSKGTKTTLTLRKEIDGELVNYVAEQEL